MTRFILFIIPLYILSCSTSNIRTVDLLPGHDRSTHEATSKNVMISTQGIAATKAGLKMYKLGGNAFDAAVAISFVISVERPQSTGLGGGGFMLIKTKKLRKPIAVDFREMAPARAHKNMYLDKKGKVLKRKSIDGIHSAGVPGLVAGVLEVHKKYGKLPLKTVMAPAIELAEKGFKVYPHLARALQKRMKVMKRFPSTTKIFFKNGKPLQLGDLLIQKDLAKTLKRIAKYGKRGFYSGKTMRAFLKTSKKYGGIFREADFKKYEVRWRHPVEGSYKGYKIFSMSPPSSGGAHVVQILNIVEPYNLKQYGPLSPTSIHLTASAMQMAFADRAKYLGDTDYVQVPLMGIISKKYASSLRKKIKKEKATPSNKIRAGDPFPYESDETTHFTVADKSGNIITSTQTINYYMGSGLVIEGTGVVLNDEMDDFSAKAGVQNIFGAVGGNNNLVAPGKRPLSSMSPTIVFKDNKPILALGTASGTRILTCVAQTILNYIEYDLPLYDSVSLVRFHHQWTPDQIRIDNPGIAPNVESKLWAMGHKIKRKDLGCKMQAISFEKGLLHGVSDPRGEGQSAGL